MELVRVAKHQDNRVAAQEHLVDNAILHNRLALRAAGGILCPNLLNILQNPTTRQEHAKSEGLEKGNNMTPETQTFKKKLKR